MPSEPYCTGDWVEIADKFGKVENVQMFSTTLLTPGSKVLVIPNGKVTDGIITNFSTKGRAAPAGGDRELRQS